MAPPWCIAPRQATREAAVRYGAFVRVGSLPIVPLALLAALLAGCAAPSVDAVKAGPLVPGDANGDGRFDISDPIYVTRNLFDKGPAPVCAAAVDMIPDGNVEVGDGLSLLATLFSPLPYLAPLASGACDSATTPSGAKADRLRWGFSGGGTTTVTLESMDRDVDGWSLGVTADGCTIAAATTNGTVAADRFDGGQRAVGYENTRVTSAGAVSAVVLGWNVPARLAASPKPYDVLQLTLTKGDTCNCTLSLSNDVVGDGLAVATVVTAGGRSYLPELASAKVNVCK